MAKSGVKLAKFYFKCFACPGYFMNNIPLGTLKDLGRGYRVSPIARNDSMLGALALEFISESWAWGKGFYGGKTQFEGL